MYSKLYRSIFDGTLYGKFEPLTVFMAMLALSDRHGEVDASPERIAGSLGCGVDFVLRGIEELMAPDSRSRTPAEEGRRIVPLLNDEGQPRQFGWRIVNYAKYRAIRNDDERRAYQRDWVRQKRSEHADAKSRLSLDLVDKDRHLPNSTHAEAEAEAENLKPTVGLKPDDKRSQGKVENEKRRQERAAAMRAIDYLNERAGKGFPHSESNIKLAAARIRYDGVTEDDLRAVIDLKVSEAAQGEFNRKYLRPGTLFGAEKFSQYIGEVKARTPAPQKRDEQMRVFAESPAGDLVQIGEYPDGDPEVLARRAFTEYRSAPWMRGVRNVVCKLNGTQSRFSVAELGQEGR